jgi:hypothetical protein
LQAAVSQSEETSREFSNQVLKDIEFFNSCKLTDIKALLSNMTDIQLEFHEKVT